MVVVPWNMELYVVLGWRRNDLGVLQYDWLVSGEKDMCPLARAAIQMET